MGRLVVTDKPKRRIEVVEPRTRRRITPEEIESALGAERVAVIPAGGSPMSAFALRQELFRRLRSTGGRPGLDGVDMKPKIPMRRFRWKKLERLAEQVESDGFRPSPAQLASIILDVGIDQFEGDLTNRVAERQLGGGKASTLDILRIPIAKDDLLKMSAPERSLFLLLGYASNQVNALWKLIIISTNHTPEDPVEQRVTGAQTQILVRLLIGVMREGLKLVEKRFLGSLIGREYVPLLDVTATAALDRLKKRLGSTDQLVVIRDNFGFHHPNLLDMDAAFQLAIQNQDAEELDWCLYVNRGLLNTFFFVSDFVLVHGMANALGEKDVNEAHRKLLGDLAPIANDLSEFTFGFAGAIFRKYFGAELKATVVARIYDAPSIDDLKLPFYVEMPDPRNR
jgi:hypothetical protein